MLLHLPFSCKKTALTNSCATSSLSCNSETLFHSQFPATTQNTKLSLSISMSFSCNPRTWEMQKVTTLVKWQVRNPLLLEATQVLTLSHNFWMLKNTCKECNSSHIFVVFKKSDKVFYRRYPDFTRTLLLSKWHRTITAHSHCSTVVSY
jgi:hypothetical protein